jgi:hypothetical protein
LVESIHTVHIICGREVVIRGHGVERDGEHEILQLFVWDIFDLPSLACLPVDLRRAQDKVRGGREGKERRATFDLEFLYDFKAARSSGLMAVWEDEVDEAVELEMNA